MVESARSQPSSAKRCGLGSTFFFSTPQSHPFSKRALSLSLSSLLRLFLPWKHLVKFVLGTGAYVWSAKFCGGPRKKGALGGGWVFGYLRPVGYVVS